MVSQGLLRHLRNVTEWRPSRGRDCKITQVVCMIFRSSFVAGKWVDSNIHHTEWARRAMDPKGMLWNAVLGNVNKEAGSTFTSMSAIEGSPQNILAFKVFFPLAFWNHSKWCIVWSSIIHIQYQLSPRYFCVWMFHMHASSMENCSSTMEPSWPAFPLTLLPPYHCDAAMERGVHPRLEDGPWDSQTV